MIIKRAFSKNCCWRRNLKSPQSLSSRLEGLHCCASRACFHPRDELSSSTILFSILFSTISTVIFIFNGNVVLCTQTTCFPNEVCIANCKVTLSLPHVASGRTWVQREIRWFLDWYKVGSWLRGDQGAGIKGLGSRGWEQGCSAQQPLLSYRACCSTLPSPKYQGLMRPQIRETSAAENRIPFLLILKNVCGYLNSPTSLADPRHLANAPRAALHHLPARPACR